MFLPASPLLSRRRLWGPRSPDSVAETYPGAWAAGSGRAALLKLLRYYGFKPGDKVLLPAYVCPSVPASLSQNGFRPSYYGLAPDLTPDWPDYENALRKSPVKASLVIHYWGLPQPVDDLVRLAGRAGVPLIEDCALALFSRQGGRLLGSFGQGAVFSLTKSLPLPDGGLAWSAGGPIDGAPPRGQNCLGLLKMTCYRAEAAGGFSLRTALLASRRVRAEAYRQDERRRAVEGPISQTSWAIAQRCSESEVVSSRRAAYAAWAERLAGRPGVELWAEELPQGVCPIGLPILLPAERRDDVRDALHRRGVATRSFWDALPQAVTAERYPGPVQVSRRVLTLPVHQRVEPRIMDRVAGWIGRMAR